MFLGLKFVSTLAFVQTNTLCGWCLRHSVWLKAPWVVGIFCLEKLSWRWYFWLGRNRSDEWVSEATICRVVYIPNAGLQLIPTDWVCCFRCRLLTRGNLQNIKHGLLVRHHDTRKWMHKPECCFFFGIFFHQNSQGMVLVNSSCVTTLHCDGKINPVQWYTNGLHSREWVNISHETFAQLLPSKEIC